MIMRHNKIYVILAALLCVYVVGCKEDAPSFVGFESDTSTIEAGATGGEYDVAIRSSKEWTAVVADPWVMVSPANGRGEVKCIIKVDSSLVNDTRTTDIRFSAGGELLQQIAINQSGFAKSITPEKPECRIDAWAKREDRWFETEVTTNIEFSVTPEYDGDEQWLTVKEHVVDLDRGARPRSTRLHIEWKMNPEPAERVARLLLQARNSDDTLDEPVIITVRQHAAPVIEDNRSGDSLAVLTIFDRLECWSDNGISTDKSMDEWECLRLWRANDVSLPAAEAVGRVRDLDLSFFRTEEGIPQEIRYLKYLETLSLFGNTNTMLKSIPMGEEVCELRYLKALRVAAYGISELPKNFIKLGANLETLDLNSNNLNNIPEVLTRENFPKLRSLNLSSNRRKSLSDLRTRSSVAGDEGIGLYEDMAEGDAIRQLLLWEELEELALSYNYIEGTLPDFRVGEEGVRGYTYDDVRDHGDTLTWAVEQNLPRILPNMRSLRLNLNFMTGNIPDWLLYHPRLMEWGAEVLVFQQQEPGIDSYGRVVRFDNAPTSFEYYFQRYPLYRGRYEFNDEIER